MRRQRRCDEALGVVELDRTPRCAEERVTERGLTDLALCRPEPDREVDGEDNIV